MAMTKNLPQMGVLTHFLVLASRASTSRLGATRDDSALLTRLLRLNLLGLGCCMSAPGDQDSNGLDVPSGVYFSRLEVNGRVLSRKLVVAR